MIIITTKTILKMKKQLLLLVMTLLPMVASINALAHDFEAVNADGKTIYYKFNSDCTTVSVSYRGNDHSSYSNEYSGDIVIPESVTYNGKSYPIASIDDYAFYACDNLLSVTIPNTITYIGMGAFHLSDGSLLHDIVINITDLKAWCDIDFSGGEGIGWPFALYLNGNLLDNLVIPNGVTTIRQGAFTNCYLTSISIPEGVTSIEDYAFCSQMSGSVTVSIPSTVASIGYQAFGCSGLTSVIVNQNTPIVLDRPVFSYSYQATLYVPYGSKTKYEAAAYWKDFKEIVELSPVITFADANVKALCVANWDTDEDGELSEAEAAAVTSLGTVFQNSKGLTTFDELKYFTGLTSIDDKSFYYSSITGVTLPANVTRIGWNAFSGSNLISVAFPDNVKNIGNSAFSYCTSLVSVDLGNGLESIGVSSFFGCTNMEVLTFGSCKPSFDVQAFSDCNGLKKIIAKDLVAWCSFNHGTSTANPMFYAHHLYDGNDAEITDLVIPSEVTSIGNNAFYQCTGLKTLKLHNQLKNIGRSAFSDCNGLTGTITIPKSITGIARNVFYNCSGITDIELPKGIKSVGYFAFGNCNSLTSITIPSTVESIDDGAFYCENLSSVVSLIQNPFSIAPSMGWSKFTDATYNNAILHVPYGTQDKYAALDGWKEFKTIVEMAPPSPAITFADANVKSICVANWDTNDDGELSEAEAAAVTELGSVFKWAYNTNEKPSLITTFNELRYFTSLTSIGEDAFSGCSSLTSLTLPSTTTRIENGAFSNCSKLLSIDIPSQVTFIGNQVFQNCSSLISISIPAAVKHIGVSLVAGCSKLASIVVDDNNPCYDSRDNCNAIVSNNPDILVAGCKNTVIPNTVNAIGYGAFEGCEGLVSVIIPSSVVKITNRAFWGCENLESVTFPNSLISIKDNAFEDCKKLTSITIPSTVTLIGSRAFFGCSALETVKTTITSPFAIEEDVFQIINKETDKVEFTKAKLQVPFGCKEAYLSTSCWNLFAEIEEQERCATPTISFIGGKLHFECETEGVEYHYEFTASESGKGTGNDISITPIYAVKVYASKPDYKDSEEASLDINAAGIKGDTNQDGKVTITDAVSVVNIILNNGETTAPAMESPADEAP